MSARPVIAFDARETFNEKADRLRDERYAIRERAGAIHADARGIVDEALDIAWKFEKHYAQRAVKAERALRAILANDDVPDGVREKCRATLLGKEAAVRDARLLTDYEAAMIRQYRTMDVAGRQAIRTLFELAARASGAPDSEQV